MGQDLHFSQNLIFWQMCSLTPLFPILKSFDRLFFSVLPAKTFGYRPQVWRQKLLHFSLDVGRSCAIERLGNGNSQDGVVREPTAGIEERKVFRLYRVVLIN